MPVTSRRPSVAGALDEITDSFAGLFMLGERVLTSYTGPLFRVRRASDDAEQDIGWVAGTNLADLAALAAFCSGNDGFLLTHYDQSGNADHISQSTKTLQPKVSDATTGPVLLNGVLAAAFDSTDDSLGRADAFGVSGTGAFTMGAIWTTANTSTVTALWWLGTNSVDRVLWRQPSSATQIEMNYTGGSRTFTSPNLTTGVNNTLTRRAAGESIGDIPVMHNGTDLTELSSVNPSTVPSVSNTQATVGVRSGAGAINGLWAGGFVSAVRWSDASYAIWNAYAAARFGA